jgi:hypothetical protein
MPAQTPLFIYFKQGMQLRITNHMITEHLHTMGIAVNQPYDYTIEVPSGTLTPNQYFRPRSLSP